MKKRVFIIHGWSGYPEEGWLPWLERELESKGFKVQVPAMPETEHPKIKVWILFLSKLVGKADENTFFVGHSIGCQTILRYLATIEEKVGGVILVAPWVHLMNLEGPEEEKIAQSWLTTPIRWKKIKNRAKNFVAIFSDNDQWVPSTDAEIFKERLGAKIIIEKQKGHFSGEDGIRKVPVVLSELLKIAEEANIKA